MALPLPYTIDEQTTYTVVPSHAVWRDPARADTAELIRRSEKASRRRDLYFPQVLRDARRIGEYYPGPLAAEPREHGPARRVARSPWNRSAPTSTISAEVERVFYPEIERLLLDFFPGATDALVYNHDVFDKDYAGDPREDQDAKTPGP